MHTGTQWTHSDVWSQLATTPQCSFKIGVQQSAKKHWNRDRRVICNATGGIEAGRRVIRYRGVSDGSDGGHPLWRSHSARTDIFFADVTRLLRSFWWIPFECRERCGGVLMVGSPPSSSIISPERPPSDASLCPLNGCVQVLLWLCLSTICSQIDCMDIYRETGTMHAIIRCSESCDYNKDQYDKTKCVMVNVSNESG